MDHFVGMRQVGAEAWTKWRSLISEQAESGQSGAVFCRERGLHVPGQAGAPFAFIDGTL
jgi:hypothetical protein